MAKIDIVDPLIVSVNSEEFDIISTAYLKIGGSVNEVGDGIRLILVDEYVVARFRIDRAQ